ncbi:MAG: Response regulator rcp1 [Candidatus Aerophobetes bacterium ADurb.Bin490]|nr:MAG: Response regulator rcp1 [Candidatus Aerophobetes bacterium ADurb.Bin490]HNZ29262.1 response regulator [Candidatus Goldiibacteriota bacterium]HPI02697.1 response regulator [Candidatus Goldiibacteriota bacterium]HRQ43676.1 response regulator [Candidatus Goldiibacteriota bacterium]
MPAKVSRSVDILLVEDNSADIKLIEECFKDLTIKCNINVATDGEQAVDILKRNGTHLNDVRPDVVLLDLKIPKKDGFEVLSEIKSDTSLSGIPVIILSSSSLKNDVDKAYALKANFYITKEMDIENYVQIAKYIEDYWLSKSDKRAV